MTLDPLRMSLATTTPLCIYLNGLNPSSSITTCCAWSGENTKTPSRTSNTFRHAVTHFCLPDLVTFLRCPTLLDILLSGTRPVRLTSSRLLSRAEVSEAEFQRSVGEVVRRVEETLAAHHREQLARWEAAQNRMLQPPQPAGRARN